MQEFAKLSMIIRSLLYGWLGAIVAGLVVGVTAIVFGIPEDRMIALSTVAGVLLGSAGMGLPWARRRAITKAARRGTAPLP